MNAKKSLRMTSPDNGSNGSHHRTRAELNRQRNSGSRVALLFPRVAISVITVAFPEAETIFVEQHEAADPFHAFPSVKVRNDEAEGAAVFGGKRNAVVFEGE